MRKETEPKDLAAALINMSKSKEGLSYLVKNAKNLPKAEAHEIKAPPIHPTIQRALDPWAWTS